MAHKKWGLLIVSCFLLNTMYAQPIDDVSFFVKKIKNNYAGYNDKAQGKRFDVYLKNVLKENGTDTFCILGKIAHYFKDNHLVVYEMNTLKYHDNDTVGIGTKIKNVNEYLANSAIKRDRFEGYWLDEFNSMVAAIVKSPGKAWAYEIYLIESSYAVLPKGMLIGKIEYMKDGKYWTRYISPGVGNVAFLDTEFKSDSVMVLAEYAKLHKLPDYNITEPVLSSLTPFTFSNTGRSLDAQTYLLTIPDFSYNVGSIDSILKTDSVKVHSAKNLILDLRNNGGGTVTAYQPLFPLIYTNPIKSVKGMVLASDDLIAEYEELLKEELKAEKPDSSSIKEIQRDLALFKKGRGQLVETPAEPDKNGPVMVLPENIGIIINYACQSAAELFLLDFKQSKKVTLFGEHTFGAVDYLNAVSTYSPSGRYFFSIASAKRIVPAGEKKLDGTGIIPDVPIADNVPDWVEFVKKYYQNGKKTPANY